MISVLYVNNEGGGFPETKPVTPGTTFGDFVTNVCGISNPAAYRIRLNGQLEKHETVLSNGDKVVVTPLKIDGGC